MQQPPAVHGGSADAAIDLSTSLNPLGPSPAAVAAARAADVSRYPSLDAALLCAAAARRHQLDAGHFVPVPGSSWSIWLCAMAFLERGDECLALAPCFSEYRRATEIAGARYREVWCGPPDFVLQQFDCEQALATRPALCYLGNPGNPSASLVPADDVRRLTEKHPQTLFVVDEAFIAFAPPGSSLVGDRALPHNVIVLRSLTKELGLPGLRMGYMVANTDLASALRDVLPPWPISAPALAAAVAGMSDEEHVSRGAALAHEHLNAVAAPLRAAGVQVFPSHANYLLARAPGVAAELLKHGIAVRDCASFGLADHVRIAAPPAGTLDTVLAAVTSLPAFVA